MRFFGWLCGLCMAMAFVITFDVSDLSAGLLGFGFSGFGYLIGLLVDK